MAETCHFQVRRLGGTVVLLGVALGALVHPWFLVVAAFAGLNLVQSSFTDFCPAEYVLPDCGAGTATD
jgi:hypothetical protein